MPNSSPIFPLLIALAAMLWGGDLLLRPLALSDGWSPASVVLGEHLLLTATFGMILARGWKTFRSLTRNQWAALLFVSWGGSALATWLYTEAFTLGSPLTAILLQKTQPVFALIGAWGLLGERRQIGFWGWCVLALAGAWLLTGITRVPSLTDVHTQQAFCALGAAALWGGATVAGRVLTPVLSPALLSGARFAVAVPLLALLTRLPTVHASAPTHGPSYALLFLLLIVLLPDLLGMRLYYAGLRGTPASVATLAELCYPLTALLIGVFVQHAMLTPWQWTGFMLLFLAVLGLSLAPQVSVRVQKRLGRVS
jgi:DME family drug/metabolite transporter